MTHMPVRASYFGRATPLQGRWITAQRQDSPTGVRSVGAQAAARDAVRGSDGVRGSSVTRIRARRKAGVISPLLCNVYLHRLDRAWDTRAFGVLVRFADDLLVVCKSAQQAEAALARLGLLLAELGLAPKQAKTRIVELRVGGGGFDFLGFHHRMVLLRDTHFEHGGDALRAHGVVGFRASP